MADRSQTSTGLSVYVYGGLHKVLTPPAIVLLAKKQFCNVSLTFVFLFVDIYPRMFDDGYWLWRADDGFRCGAVGCNRVTFLLIRSSCFHVLFNTFKLLDELAVKQKTNKMDYFLLF